MLRIKEQCEIRESFKEGTLQVKSVDPVTKGVVLQPIIEVLKHKTPDKVMLEVVTDCGTVVTTQDHSLFKSDMVSVEVSNLKEDDEIAWVDGIYKPMKVRKINVVPNEVFTYDLSVPPFQNFTLSNGAVAHNSYSIGGVSLDIEKSSKYESLKQNAEGQLEKAAEAKQRTVKFIRGLQQPRFGLGVRSSFGPHVGNGILSPRSFMAWAVAVLTPALVFVSSANSLGLV